MSTAQALLAPCEILLVSRSATLVARLARALDSASGSAFRLTPASDFALALTLLGERHFAVLLFDLALLAGDDEAGFAGLTAASPGTAILALAQQEDEARARAALRRGVQDYVLPADLKPDRLPRLLRNAIERQRHQDQQHDLERQASQTLASIGDAVLSTDMDGRITYLNHVAEDMTGWSCEQARGMPLRTVFNIVDEATRQPAPDPLLRAVRENRAVELISDCMLLRRDGHEYLIEDSSAPIRGPDGTVSGAVIVFRDVGRLRANARNMAHLAQHDSLTNLPNRILFGERISNAIVLARRHHRQAAVLYLDLDGFKDINDSLGHAVGDQLLLSVTHRLLHGVRASDIVCRQGGDEFVVLLSEIESAADAAASAGKLLRLLAEPHVLEGHTLKLTASIGIGLYPQDGQEVKALLRNADSAMYAAKREGGNQYRFFVPAL